jgi:cell division protein FtsI/penicillin-binding protein 2
MTPGFFISRARIYILLGVVCLIWGVLIARLVSVQLVHGDEYQKIASNQTNGEIIVPAERGGVTDCKGRILAGNVPCLSLFAYPQKEQDAGIIADAIAPVMGVPANQLRKTLYGRLETFTWLCRKLPKAKADALLSRQIRGLFPQREMQRIYPSDGLGRDLLGVVDIDNNGISGLEYALNRRLVGSEGRSRVERDALGNIYRVAGKDLIDPRNGNNVALTIDLDWQAIVEDELRQGVDTFSAQSGIAILLKPGDGAILAMASWYPKSSRAASEKNEAISDVFEPGSVFKLITAAGALEEDVLRPEQRVDCGNGKAQFSGKWIRDDHSYSALAFRDVFRFSSNVGTANVARKLGSKTMFKYAKFFGFGRKLGVDLPGEAAGSLHEPAVWSDFFTASIAMGHGVSVTALQLAAAFNVVPSGGTLYQPYIIKQVTAPDGAVLETTAPVKVRTLLSDKTCATLRQFMESVVDSGTAKYSKSDIVDFAGKTGTAQKPNLETGGYYANRYNASFAGYFPADNPIAVGVVILDDPQPVHYAGMTAGRVFRKIAERIATLQDLAKPPEFAAKEAKTAPAKIRVPDLQGHTLSTVESLLDTLNLDITFVNTGDIIARQIPASGSILTGGERLILYLADPDTTVNRLNELIGLSVRAAVPKLIEWGYSFNIEGAGYVKSIVAAVVDSGAVDTTRSVKLLCGVD